MAQFEVFRNPRGGRYPLLLDVQADLLSPLATRVVVPLERLDRHGAPGPSGRRAITHLNPMATVRRVQYVLVFQELAAIPASALGARVCSLAARRDELIAAVDLLFTGI